MKKYRTDYIVVEGYKNVFEDRLNSLSIQGYDCFGNMNTTGIANGVWYSVMMRKTTPIEE